MYEGCAEMRRSVDWIDGNESYYCPLPADRCSVSMTRHGTPAVECYKYEGKEVGFARDVWLYLFFMLVAVVLYPRGRMERRKKTQTIGRTRRACA